MMLAKCFVVLIVSISFIGCASSSKYTTSELNNCDIGAFSQNEKTEAFQVCIKNHRGIVSDYNKSVKQNSDPKYKAEQDLKENALRIQKQAVRKIGTKMSDYIGVYGSPDNTEIINGEQVLWFNDAESPEFVTFKNGKLTSIRLDRETIASRSKQRQESYADEAKRIEQYRIDSQNRASTIYKNLNEQQKQTNESLKPKKPANVPDSTTKCKRDYLNNVVCETFNNEQ